MACPYCEIESTSLVVKEYDHWVVQVTESQQLLGYLVISLKSHKEQLVDLSDEELIEFRDVCREMQHALDAAFQPDWYNYMLMGNMTRHIHFHLIPRYRHPRLFEGRQFVDERFGKLPERRWVFENQDFLVKLAAKIREKA